MRRRSGRGWGGISTAAWSSGHPFFARMALAAVIAGADGLLYEAHAHPDEAASDGQQTLNFEESARVVTRSRRVFELRTGNDV